MRFKGLDLNLFVAFEALMETHNTALAGERLGLSQPAASAALARLRDYFGDPLLLVKGRRMYPTPFAEMLLPKIRQCLREAEGVITTSAQFDPATADRLFRLMVSDYILASVMSPLLEDLATRAPRLRFSFIQLNEDAGEHLRHAEIDLLVTPVEFAVAGIPTEPLCDENYVVAGWAQHPIFEGEITTEDVFRYGHVGVSIGGPRGYTVGDRRLDLLEHRRVIEVSTASFSVVPYLLVGTTRLTLMHERLARISAKSFDIQYRPLPFDFEPLRELVQIHETRVADPGVRWLIEQIRAQAARVD